MNVDMLYKTMEAVTDENLDMDHWGHRSKSGCGTTMCLAGHAAVAGGHQLHWEEGSRFDSIPGDYYAIETTSGESIERVGALVLGLDIDDADELFYSDAGSVDELWEHITAVTGVARPTPVAA